MDDFKLTPEQPKKRRDQRAYLKAWRAKNPRDRRAYKAAYDAANKDKIAAYREANKDRLRAKKAAYYVTHRERLLARVKAHSDSNKARILEYQADYYAANSDKVKATVAAYRRANPDKKRYLDNRRRVRKANNGGSHTIEQRLAKFALLGNICFYCGEAKKLTVDHKIPLARGGTDDIRNIVPACRSCNSSKNARTAKEYLANQRRNRVRVSPLMT